MGAAQHGAAAAGYGRPRFLAYGRVRVTHSPENSAGCGFGPMFQIICHALLSRCTRFVVLVPGTRIIRQRQIREPHDHQLKSDQQT